jgi:hypothetical protein
MEGVITTLARFGQFYWTNGAVRDRDEFRALADADWREAVIYFIREWQTIAFAGVFYDGRGWVRTSDLSRVRRALSR